MRSLTGSGERRGRHAARPTAADQGALTRERLLEVAEHLFCRRGYAATSVREVTATAGCNLASVTYHFGGKHNLYVAMFRRRLALVREQRIAGIRRALRQATGTGGLEAVLRAFAAAFLESVGDRSDGRMLLELLAREAVDGRLPREIFHAEFVEPIHAVLQEAIRTTEPDVPPEAADRCVVSIVGQLVHAVHILRSPDAASRRWLGAAPAAELVDHIVAFSAAGVRGLRGATP